MLTYIYKTEDDLYKEIINGKFQEDTKEYLLELFEDYEQRKQEPLNKTTVFEFFDVQLGEEYIFDNQIEYPKTHVEKMIHVVIKKVYERVEDDYKISQQKQ